MKNENFIELESLMLKIAAKIKEIEVDDPHKLIEASLKQDKNHFELSAYSNQVYIEFFNQRLEEEGTQGICEDLIRVGSLLPKINNQERDELYEAAMKMILPSPLEEAKLALEKYNNLPDKDNNVRAIVNILLSVSPATCEILLKNKEFDINITSDGSTEENVILSFLNCSTYYKPTDFFLGSLDIKHHQFLEKFKMVINTISEKVLMENNVFLHSTTSYSLLNGDQTLLESTLIDALLQKLGVEKFSEFIMVKKSKLENLFLQFCYDSDRWQKDVDGKITNLKISKLLSKIRVEDAVEFLNEFKNFTDDDNWRKPEIDSLYQKYSTLYGLKKNINIFFNDEIKEHDVTFKSITTSYLKNKEYMSNQLSKELIETLENKIFTNYKLFFSIINVPDYIENFSQLPEELSIKILSSVIHQEDVP